MDPAGWNVLIGSYLPRLRQFAQRHLPAGGRGAIGADDVVQEAVMKAFGSSIVSSSATMGPSWPISASRYATASSTRSDERTGGPRSFR